MRSAKPGSGRNQNSILTNLIDTISRYGFFLRDTIINFNQQES